MQKTIAIGLALVMLICLAACGTAGTNPGGADSKPADQQSADNSGSNPSAPASGVEITEEARSVESLIGVELTKMVPDAFAIDGNGSIPYFTLFFLLKEKLDADGVKAAMDTLSAYLLSVSADGKLYQDETLASAWDEQLKTEDGQVLGANLYVKIGGYGWAFRADYSHDPGINYMGGGVYYPRIYIAVERYKLS